jgi:hypothetical protein
MFLPANASKFKHILANSRKVKQIHWKKQKAKGKAKANFSKFQQT